MVSVWSFALLSANRNPHPSFERTMSMHSNNLKVDSDPSMLVSWICADLTQKFPGIHKAGARSRIVWGALSQNENNNYPPPPQKYQTKGIVLYMEHSKMFLCGSVMWKLRTSSIDLKTTRFIFLHEKVSSEILLVNVGDTKILNHRGTVGIESAIYEGWVIHISLETIQHGQSLKGVFYKSQ